MKIYSGYVVGGPDAGKRIAQQKKTYKLIEKKDETTMVYHSYYFDQTVYPPVWQHESEEIL